MSRWETSAISVSDYGSFSVFLMTCNRPFEISFREMIQMEPYQMDGARGRLEPGIISSDVVRSSLAHGRPNETDSHCVREALAVVIILWGFSL